MSSEEFREKQLKSVESYIIKLKNGKALTSFVARRLGITEQEVDRVWNEHQKRKEEPVPTGAKELNALGNILIAQYRQTSLLLSHLIEGLGQQMNEQELDKLVAQKPAEETVAQFLLKHVIVLAPFVPPSPEKLMEESEDRG